MAVVVVVDLPLVVLCSQAYDYMNIWRANSKVVISENPNICGLRITSPYLFLQFTVLYVLLGQCVVLATHPSNLDFPFTGAFLSAAALDRHPEADHFPGPITQ